MTRQQYEEIEALIKDIRSHITFSKKCGLSEFLTDVLEECERRLQKFLIADSMKNDLNRIK